MSEYADLFKEVKAQTERSRRNLFYLYSIVVSVLIAFALAAGYIYNARYEDLTAKYAILTHQLTIAKSDLAEMENQLSQAKDEMAQLIAGTRTALEILVATVEQDVSMEVFRSVNRLEDDVVRNRNAIKSLEELSRSAGEGERVVPAMVPLQNIGHPEFEN